MLLKKRFRRVLITLITAILLMMFWKLLQQAVYNTGCPLAAVGKILPTKPGELWRFSRCDDDVCVQYLAPQERMDYNSCTVRSTATEQPCACRFMNGSGRRPVALASFPGSGNTWVRGLLQLSTGICTGSLYCDKSLRRGGFPGEGVRSGSVLVVKTHKWKSRNRRVYSNFTEHFSAAIFIIRNPFHALVSERHRMASLQHTDVIGPEYFGEPIIVVNALYIIIMLLFFSKSLLSQKLKTCFHGLSYHALLHSYFINHMFYHNTCKP